MSVFKARLQEIINTNFVPTPSSNITYTDTSYLSGINKSRYGMTSDFVVKPTKTSHPKHNNQRFDLNKSLNDLGLNPMQNTRHALFYEDPTLKTVSSTNGYLNNKKSLIDTTTSSMNNFSFSIAKSQLKNLHQKSHSSLHNNSFTYTRSNSKPHTRIQKQINEINKTLHYQSQSKTGNLNKPSFTELNMDQNEYLSISPFNNRKGNYSKGKNSVIQMLNDNGTTFTYSNLNKKDKSYQSIFNKTPSSNLIKKTLMQRKNILEKPRSDADDFLSSFIDSKVKKNGYQLGAISTENNYLMKNKEKINRQILTEKISFAF